MWKLNCPSREREPVRHSIMNASQPPQPIATLICMRAGSPLDLALKAIRSTASSLTHNDIILLRIDGGLPENLELFQQAAAPVPLRQLASQRHQGLAACLNELIEEVLHEANWQLIARMDADDESLPGRMEIQRTYMAQNPDIDILGTACIEMNELGEYLQTKEMPLSHEAIIRNLPRSNPLNHPSIMIRRRVFASGLRYRTDVSRTEDYHLWIDAASKGFIFANLPQPLLNFRRDSRFFDRRGGLRQAIADSNVRLRAIRILGQNNPVNLFWVLASFGMRLLPGRLQKLAYTYVR
jgi:glycosyltransferase involved in cell wall biosynthesis